MIETQGKVKFLADYFVPSYDLLVCSQSTAKSKICKVFSQTKSKFCQQNIITLVRVISKLAK